MRQKYVFFAYRQTKNVLFVILVFSLNYMTDRLQGNIMHKIALFAHLIAYLKIEQYFCEHNLNWDDIKLTI